MVAGALVGTARTADDVVRHTGLTSRDVIVAIDELHAAGLVKRHGAAHLLPWDVLHAVAAGQPCSIAATFP
jgi:hypothetical protein